MSESEQKTKPSTGKPDAGMDAARELLVFVGWLLTVAAVVGWDWRAGMFWAGASMAAAGLHALRPIKNQTVVIRTEGDD